MTRLAGGAIPVGMTNDQLMLLAGLLLLAVAALLAVRLLRRPRAAPPAVAEREPPRVAPAPAAEGPAETSAAGGPAAEVVVPAASPYLPAPVGEADDLGRIKGIGPKLQGRLRELGVFHYSQIADWTPAQLAEVDAALGQFQGRPERDQWQSQARLLASGDLKAYERAHGKLGPDSNSGTPS